MRCHIYILEYFTQKSRFPVSLERSEDLATLGPHSYMAAGGWS